MASVIAAGLTTGTAIAIAGDTSGALVLQTNGTTTAVTISTAQVVTLAQPLPVASGGTGSTSTTYCALATNVSGTLPVANGGTGVTTSTGTGAVVLGTSPTLTTPTFDSASLATISGTAPLYMCRAWVNFNGTGTVAIRASGNVSSITDNGAGLYTVNFTTALADTNYCLASWVRRENTIVGYGAICSAQSDFTKTTSAIQINTPFTPGPGNIDFPEIDIAVFR